MCGDEVTIDALAEACELLSDDDGAIHNLTARNRGKTIKADDQDQPINAATTTSLKDFQVEGKIVPC
jgi:hypothetical protein